MLWILEKLSGLETFMGEKYAFAQQQ